VSLRRSKDVATHGVWIAEQRVGGDAERRDAVRGEPGVAAGVVLGLAPMAVPRAVDFNREARAGAVEVEDIGTGFVLAAKVEGFGIAAEMAPEAAFGRGHLAAELAG